MTAVAPVPAGGCPDQRFGRRSDGIRAQSKAGGSMRFNRNIIIRADVDRLVDPERTDPKTLTREPPSGYVAGARPEPGRVTVPSEDDYLTKVVKYVPVEVLAAYLLMAGVIDSNVSGKHDHAMWLGGLLIGTLALTIPYDIRVLSIVRWQQVAISVVGIVVYVFALGGWFATTTWYHQWYASIVVPVFGLLIAVFRLPPLPANSNPQQPADPKTSPVDNHLAASYRVAAITSEAASEARPLTQAVSGSGSATLRASEEN